MFGALEVVFSSFPFLIKTFQTDNGSEFLNAHLVRWAEEKGVSFLMSGEYKKDENSHVDLINGRSVRNFLGYKRLETLKERGILNKAYRTLNLLTKLF